LRGVCSGLLINIIINNLISIIKVLFLDVRLVRDNEFGMDKQGGSFSVLRYFINKFCILAFV
jgi:hypothetical protein